jgi:hypothetical protein
MFEIRSFAELALFLTSRDIILAGEMKMRKTIVAILTVRRRRNQPGEHPKKFFSSR